MSAMKNETSGVPTPDVPTPENAEELDDFQESVDQYMTNLIQRLHGSRGAEYVSTPGDRQGMATQPAAPKPAEPVARPTALPPASDTPRVVRQPETASELSALRELANEHARHAIHTNLREQDFRGAYTKLAVAGLAIAVSFALLNVWRLEQPLALAAAATSIMVAVRWSWQYLMLTSSR